MKLLFRHELPRRLRSAELYLEFLNASFHLSVDGPKASVTGSIGGPPNRAITISDREYSCYRASHDVLEVIDEDEDRVVLKTADGYEEEWVRPRWVLTGVRRAREMKR